jgi:hypothetical protein
MRPTKPYQPLLLRILHGVNALIVILAILTAFVVYNTYDGRFGKVTVPEIADIIGIHGTFGKILILGVMPSFALYSFFLGKKRLIQGDSFAKVTQLIRGNSPSPALGWYSLHRIVNTVTLLALALAIFSGIRVKEEWLPAGELTHIWYSLHLIAWAVLVVCLALHLLMSAKIGGLPLMLSMFDIKYRSNDSSLTDWLDKIRSLGRRS